MIYEVKLARSGSTAQDVQARELLNNQTATIKVTFNKHLATNAEATADSSKTEGETLVDTSGSRVKGYLVNANPSNAFDYTKVKATNDTVTSLAMVDESLATGQAVAWLVVFVDGQSSGSDYYDSASFANSFVIEVNPTA